MSKQNTMLIQWQIHELINVIELSMEVYKTFSITSLHFNDDSSINDSKRGDTVLSLFLDIKLGFKLL